MLLCGKVISQSPIFRVDSIAGGSEAGFDIAFFIEPVFVVQANDTRRELAVFKSDLNNVGGASTLLGLNYRDTITINFL